MIVVIVRWVLVVWITRIRVVLVAVAVAVGGLLLWAVHRSRVVPVVRRRLLDDDHRRRFLKPVVNVTKVTTAVTSVLDVIKHFYGRILRQQSHLAA